MATQTTELQGPAGAGGSPAPRGAALGSVATALPEKVVPNAPIAERLGVEESWIVERTGIRERRTASPDERLADLATTAARRALERAGLDPVELDMVLVGTMSQDEITPNTAPLVAAELGATGAAALDVGGACVAWVGALALGVGYVESGRAGNALVIGADILSRFTDHDDRRTAALFADGAGAAVVTPSGGPRIGPVVLGADGARADLIYARHDERKLRMQGHDTFKHAVNRLTEVTKRALGAAGVDASDIDLFVYHQANRRILRAVGERLGLPGERVADYMDHYGNTSAASIPIALAEAEAEGKLVDGARVLLASFGAGFTWGGVVVEWGHDGA